MAEALAKQKAEQEPIAASRNGVETPADVVARGKATTGASLHNFVALSAVLRRNPDDVQRAEALIRSGSGATPVLVSALAGAGTEPAQRVLRTLWRDPRMPPETQKGAALALLRTKTPSRESAQLLVELLDDATWRNYAELGLGTYVRLFGDAAMTSQQKYFGDALVRHVEAVAKTGNCSEALLGISNSGYMGAMPTVQAHLKDKVVEVRASAVQALRLMSATPEVDQLIIDAAHSDTEVAVRLAALSAMENRTYTPALGKAVQEKLAADQDARVRVNAVTVIKKWAGFDPALRSALALATTTDESETVRERASSALKELSRDGT